MLRVIILALNLTLAAGIHYLTETLNISNYTNLTSNRLIFIQYIAWIRPQCSLRGLHIRITWFSLYGIRIPLFFLTWYPYALISLYGNTAHCFVYGVAMGCYGLFIVTRTKLGHHTLNYCWLALSHRDIRKTLMLDIYAYIWLYQMYSVALAYYSSLEWSATTNDL